MQLKEIRLQTSNPSALSTFYKNTLLLSVTQMDNNSFSVTAGTSKIIFDKTRLPGNPFYHFAFNIPSNKFEEAFQWMKARTTLLWLDDYKSHIADFINWHAKSFYFVDPAGNILEFIARFDLKDVEVEPFAPAHLRNVSEIGLVFTAESFDSKVHELLARYPLSYFDKQPPMPQFRAVGNDEGLLVIVPENRIWFSTRDTLSKIFPLEISFMENGKLMELKV